jgi:hypothetical protein
LNDAIIGNKDERGTFDLAFLHHIEHLHFGAILENALFYLIDPSLSLLFLLAADYFIDHY